MKLLRLMLLSKILVLNLLLFNIVNHTTKNNTTFISPLKIPISLSANFGELRIDHFHSGIDIKTQGVTGKEVVAAAQGYIYRITVSPGGFGKALYLRHSSGYSTVYGHLDRFSPEIEKYVKEEQYAKKSFLVTLSPPDDRFQVKQGDIIAYSGNTGSSGGPHLHFEIRKSDSEIPVNPLAFELGTSDNLKPVIEKLVVYPVNKNTLVNSRNRKRVINVTGSNGRYSVPADQEIVISGAAGFGIKSYDLIDDGTNRCGLYSLEMRIDSNTVFRSVLDGFSFYESRYINSHIDYELYQKDNIYVERTYLLPNDKLSTYKNLVNRGIFLFGDNRVHHVEIIAADIDGNKSVLTFRVRSQEMKAQNTPLREDENTRMMACNHSNSYENEDIKLSIPDGALYDTLLFSYKRTAGGKSMLSDVHSVHNIYTPLHKPCVLSIKPDSVIQGKKAKMLIVKLEDDWKKSAIAGNWDGDFISAEIRTFGNYFVGIDTIPPEITAKGLTQGINLSGRKEIRIRITDDLSGINYYEPEIDGKWALFEFDQKNNVLIYTFDPERITRGTKHSLSLKVADNKNNISYFSCNFIW